MSEDSTVLKVGNYTSYEWSDGSMLDSIIARSSEEFRVTVTDGTGCKDSTFVQTQTFNSPFPLIVGDDSFCKGDSTIIQAESGFVSYNWSTGANTTLLTVKTPSVYVISVEDFNGCNGTNSISILESPQPTPFIDGALSFCGGSSINCQQLI